MLIPIFIVRDVPEAIRELVSVSPDPIPFYAVRTRGSEELHLNLPHGGGLEHSSATILCEHVDAVFASFVARGLAVPSRADSPVHEAPLDQTWGAREVYIDDPSGNTLILQQPQGRSYAGLKATTIK